MLNYKKQVIDKIENTYNGNLLAIIEDDRIMITDSSKCRLSVFTKYKQVIDLPFVTDNIIFKEVTKEEVLNIIINLG